MIKFIKQLMCNHEYKYNGWRLYGKDADAFFEKCAKCGKLKIIK